MNRIEAVKRVFLYDRLLRFNIDMLTGIRAEIKADIEEARLLSDALLNDEDRKFVKDFLSRLEGDFLNLLSETLENLYDEYEIFNFDLTFLSNIPDEISRELERLDLISRINAKLENLKDKLADACFVPQTSKEVLVILTPFRIYCELINHAIEFNKKFEN